LITSSIFIGQLSIPLVVEPLHAALGMKNMFLVLALVLVSASLLAALIPRFSRLQHAAATRSEPALK
jgi:hypothetical protein